MSVLTLNPTSATVDMTTIPTISLVAPTPTRTTTTISATSNDTPTRSSVSPSYRLLYRGALSLSDSLLLLDGLTFGARLDSPSKQSAFNLLQNPLALALESMRGRPSLRLLGEVSLKDVYLDESGGIEMDIHPLAVLSQTYFENMFCLTSYSDVSRSDVGLKVALGDSNGPETTEMVIFGQIFSSSSESNAVRLCVARLQLRPPSVQPQKRLPRPDDPIPRKPPAFFVRDLKRTNSFGGNELKRVASSSALPGPSKKLKVTESDKVFKVPELPTTGKSKGKGKEKDVFGDVDNVVRAESKGSKGDEGQPMTVDEGTLEKANKNVIKRATIEYLGRTKDPTGRSIDKTHADFKDLYGTIYRGVGFALRAKMRTCTLDLGVVDRLVDMHALMYLGGCGGSAQVMW